MIIPLETREYFQKLQAGVSNGMALFGSPTPYMVLEDPFINNYELLRETWFQSVPIQVACQKYNLSRSHYDENEERFVKYGVVGLFPEIKALVDVPDLERLVLMVSKAHPRLSPSAILQIAEAVPATQAVAKLETITQILASYGRSSFSWPTDIEFWSRIQRTISQLDRLKQTVIKGRDRENRLRTFFQDKDLCQKRLELVRKFFFQPNGSVKQACLHYGISTTSYYRLLREYRFFGPWTVIPANMPGKDSMSDETELNIVIHKLRNPHKSAQQTVTELELNCSRSSVHRVFSRWGLTDRTRPPTVVTQLCNELTDDTSPPSSESTAFHFHREATLLDARRIDPQFEQLCNKMRTRAYYLCDPGPLLMAPFVNDLGIIQALESYGPALPHDRTIGHPVLLNVFRILGGYRNILKLKSNRVQSVSLASGLAMHDSRSLYREDILKFSFKHIQSLRLDLIKRAKELGLIEGKKIALDFRFKTLFDACGNPKNSAKASYKPNVRYNGVLPHASWDITCNTILSINYCSGIRSPQLPKQYCDKDIFKFLDPQLIEEIHMEAELSKENSLYYIKQALCPNGDIYICLNNNIQTKKLIAPELWIESDWEAQDDHDELKTFNVTLPKTKLPFKVAMLRNLENRQNIRFFCSTRLDLNPEEILLKYHYRKMVENGIKDLIPSYFFDETALIDPQKAEFEFYSILAARLAYEHFLNALGSQKYNRMNGGKMTLQQMRDLLFDRRNFTLHQDSKGNLVVTLIDSDGDDFELQISAMLDDLMVQDKNRVLWWGNRGVLLRFKDQYSGFDNLSSHKPAETTT